jgi:predicted ester cyclase
MPATDRTIGVDGGDILRFENGKAVEHWGNLDETRMMQQLGFAPMPGSDAK